MIFIYPIYNHNWRNISTIYIYNKTTIKRNILTSNKIHREVGRAKGLSPPLHCTSQQPCKSNTCSNTLHNTVTSDDQLCKGAISFKVRHPAVSLYNHYVHKHSTQLKYHISRPIRRTFFPKKCDLNSIRILCAEGKYYFQTYKYPYIFYMKKMTH